MSTLEHAAIIGKRGLLRLSERSGRLLVPVLVKDAREAFGRLDVLVEPIEGEGQTWVSSERVRLG